MDQAAVSRERWKTGSSYRQYVGRWSELVAVEFVRQLDQPGGLDWLDVGCGTGTLAGVIVSLANPRRVAGIDPSEGFIEFAEQAVADPRVVFSVGDARALPYGDATFNVVVSGLVLNFVPTADQPTAATELKRVCRPGGTVAAYVWDYAEGMQMMRHFWDAATALDPSARDRNESVRFGLCQPEPLQALFEGAGLRGVEVTGITVETVFRDFDDYWNPFLTGEAPAPAYCMSLSPEDRERLRQELMRRLPTAPDGSIPLTTRAWAVRGAAPA
jgi:SAM-dependent methyltransferase